MIPAELNVDKIKRTCLIIDKICAECRNYFWTCKFYGVFDIVGGRISLPDAIQNGQYFRIIGSTFNDGVYQAPNVKLTDETFDGAIWAMAVPPTVIALAAEIDEYNNSDAAKISPYTSESFGGYSYTRNTTDNGLPFGWQTVFADKLKRYRRLHI